MVLGEGSSTLLTTTCGICCDSRTHRRRLRVLLFEDQGGVMPNHYARYERAGLNQSDTYFALQKDGMSYYRAAMGVRFDLDVKSALKLEFARTKDTDLLIDEWTDAMLDYAIRF